MTALDKSTPPPVPTPTAESAGIELVTIRARLNLAGMAQNTVTSVPPSARLDVMLADGLVELVEMGDD